VKTLCSYRCYLFAPPQCEVGKAMPENDRWTLTCMVVCQMKIVIARAAGKGNIFQYNVCRHVDTYNERELSDAACGPRIYSLKGFYYYILANNVTAVNLIGSVMKGNANG
jgi:hypothetical protein